MKLIENGLDSLKKAITTLNNLPDYKSLEYEYEAKEVILKLHHAIETLCKHLIQEKADYLIYGDLNDYFENFSHKLIYGSKTDLKKKTIYFEDALKRMVVLYKKTLKPTQYAAFTNLNELRNSLTHHEYNFEEKQVEYLSTQVLIVFLDILNKEIPNFQKYIIDNNLDLKINYAKSEFEITQYILLFSIYKRINISQSTMIELKKDNKKYTSKLTKISSNKHYHSCPVCNQNYFVKEGIFTEFANEIGYYGTCKLCDFEIHKFESLVMNWYFGEIKNITLDTGWIQRILHTLMYSTDLSKEADKDELDKIKQIYTENKGTITQYVQDVPYKINEVLDPYGRSITNQMGADSSSIDEFINMKAQNLEIKYHYELNLNDISNTDLDFIKKYISNFCILLGEDETVTEIFIDDFLNSEYTVYTEVQYHNPSENIEESVSVDIYFKFSNDVINNILNSI